MRGALRGCRAPHRGRAGFRAPGPFLSGGVGPPLQAAVARSRHDHGMITARSRQGKPPDRLRQPNREGRPSGSTSARVGRAGRRQTGRDSVSGPGASNASSGAPGSAPPEAAASAAGRRGCGAALCGSTDAVPVRLCLPAAACATVGGRPKCRAGRDSGSSRRATTATRHGGACRAGRDQCWASRQAQPGLRLYVARPAAPPRLAAR